MSQAKYSTDVQRHELFLSDLQLDRIREVLIHTDQDLEATLGNLGINIDPDRANTLLESDGFFQCSVCLFWDTTSNISNLDDNVCLECAMSTWEEDPAS